MTDATDSRRMKRIAAPRRPAQMRVEGSAGEPKLKPTATAPAKTAKRKSASSGGKSDQPRFTVFLDRDGVFNVNPKVGLRFYRNLRWLPGAREAFARLNEPGIQTSLATNQPWVGLLTATPGMIHRLHAQFKAELESHGGRLDHIEAAFAHPLLMHRRTKPKPGMLEDGAAAFASEGRFVDKRRAVMVGDKVKDAQAAAGFGVPAILLATTYDAATLEEKARRKGVPYAAIVPDLATAVDLILSWAAA
ncbi:MAG: D-glycero-D-manno-heptose 1,7-bisphosphate phosphatase [Thermoplasmata archaeon]|nr:D-glycero-D-manno-heptose 1,7-bisphosphate phosphatase [Thermoplasmata archaeon]